MTIILSLDLHIATVAATQVNFSTERSARSSLFRRFDQKSGRQEHGGG